MTSFELPEFLDPRGSLAVAEYPHTLPFVVRRVFFVFNVPTTNVRGKHAHKELHQFLICAKGSCSVLLDDGIEQREYRLESPSQGLHIRPMIWAAQYDFSADAVLVVLASDAYDPEDYIRDYTDFLERASMR